MISLETWKAIFPEYESNACLNYIATFDARKDAIMMTYDSGADGRYFSESDCKKADLPIIRRSTKRVGVTNGGTSTGKYVTNLPFQHLSEQAAEADTFDDLPKLHSDI